MSIETNFNFLNDCGESKNVGGNSVFSLMASGKVWFVDEGAVDIFCSKLDGDTVAGPRTFITRVEEGGLFFSFDCIDIGGGLGFVAAGVPGTKIIEVQREVLFTKMADANNSDLLNRMIRGWLVGLGKHIRMQSPDRNCAVVEVGEQLDLSVDQGICAKSGIVWVKTIKGSGYFNGDQDSGVITSGTTFPVSEKTWLKSCSPETAIEVLALSEVLKVDKNLVGLDQYQRFIFRIAVKSKIKTEEEEAQRLLRKRDQDENTFSSALSNFTSVISKKAEEFSVNLGDNDLINTLQVIGKKLDMEFKTPKDFQDITDSEELLEHVCRTSRIRYRRIELEGEWWKIDSGPLLVFLNDGFLPVSLMPTGKGRFHLMDIKNGRKVIVNAKIAKELAAVGYTFYKTFKPKKIGIIDIAKQGAFGNRKDIIQMFWVGIAGGALGIVLPMVTGSIFDTVIPESNMGMLITLTCAMVIAAYSSMIFEITRSVALLRIEAKANSTIQASVWDRLLELPVPFFRKYSVGDLAIRANNVNEIRRILSGTVTSSVMGGIFSVFSLLLLFYYSWRLAALATGLTMIMVVVTLISGFYTLSYQRKLYEVQGKISGMLLQFIMGISKLRITGAEGRAFNRWSEKFTTQQKLTFKIGNISNYLEVVNAIFPIFSSVCIFYYVMLLMKTGKGELSTGQFLAFNAAFGSFLAAVLAMSESVLSASNVINLFERTKPILDTLPEVDEDKSPVGKLKGKIEVSHVKFRYDLEGTYILDDVSFSIEPGQFVALVGGSGSGKSTLLRLLLGFEKAELGAIYYDDQDLKEVNITDVRKQIGVVLQNGRVMSGDIFSNIVGASNYLTVDDAWEASRMSGLEEDVKAMPMGMHTVVSDGGGTLSGGQRQRLMIARAIVNRPKVLFFDEATSALDNKTQSVVTNSLDKLHATRVVIAHRLSTIINADKIIVLDKGKVVQIGRYKELIEQEGLFADLVKRQLS